MRVGIVGDLHAPFVHPMYLRFCLDVFSSWRVDRINFIGDVNDQHALSFHEHDPNGMSAEDEALAAYPVIQRWYKTFPDADVEIGNHDFRPDRVARKAGLPERYLKSFGDVWQTPRWRWDVSCIIDDVLYEHGTGTSGKNAAINAAVEARKSRVQGHVHCYAGVQYHANDDSIIFGLNVGCGIDIREYAFHYARPFKIRPNLGCGIVIDGESAHFIPMPCGRGERYHRSRAGSKYRRPRITWPV